MTKVFPHLNSNDDHDSHFVARGAWAKAGNRKSTLKQSDIELEVREGRPMASEPVAPIFQKSRKMGQPRSWRRKDGPAPNGQECPFHATTLVQSPRRSLRPTPQRFGCPSVGLAGVA